KANRLMSVRTMSGVANDPQGVDLFYGQSYSVVKFLTDTYGQPKMVELLKMLKNGASIDEGLAKNYQLDQDTLDDAWRKSIGAAPRPADQRGKIDVTPIAVPSIAAMGVPQSVTAAGQTSGAGAVAGVAPGGGNMLFMVGAGLIGLGVLAAGAMVVQGMLKKGGTP
ncbi:MAG: peptidase MA family metallohydrolase, partial [Chloroflexi bacterium]|nr:peptidase MA family metallohydrolase [Chloroflexota bacterium]